MKEVKLKIQRKYKNTLYIVLNKKSITTTSESFSIGPYNTNNVAKIIFEILKNTVFNDKELKILEDGLEYYGHKILTIPILIDLFEKYENPEDTEKLINEFAKLIQEKVNEASEKIRQIDSIVQKEYEVTIKVPNQRR